MEGQRPFQLSFFLSSTMRRIEYLFILFYCALASSTSSEACRSNSTHIAWTVPTEQEGAVSFDQRQQRKGQQQIHAHNEMCQYETVQEAQTSAYNYLRGHVLEFDLPFLQTLGFSVDASDDPDGLDSGLVGVAIQLALQVKVMFEYADVVPRDVWREFVLSYAHLNEARSNVRQLLFEKLVQNMSATAGIATEQLDIPTAVYVLNRDMWRLLAPRDTNTIHFISSQTPLIFDPMSVLSFGYASCTGMAILFAHALRAAGIPARVAGTAAWHGDRNQGNHNWVEVWWDGDWYFMEPSSGGDERTYVDTIDRDPCTRWFCTPDRFHAGANGTHVAAATLESNEDTFFRLAWEWNNVAVPSEDRTEYYMKICSQCS